ncbi:hypothetical protein FE257_003706 [Aspergillus nanangensis]|uniref:RGS domain-containing protein n=1 Tax=Aspergillus nanangensis TaxID=2582783 RepID=A0AAD4CS34_ASPNN|nr:hypothetical protein FE257_003706 [Aspergillus nanangensis]
MANAEATSAINPPETPNDATSSNSRPQPEDVLAGSALEPYTFESFVDYLSQDHCIEILDFLSDAKVYIDTYRASAASIRGTKMTSESQRLGKQWKTLMSTYIAPGAPDELNIPESISASLLDNTDVIMKPPSPTKLEPAIRHAHKILTESALIPFIQSYMGRNPNYRIGGALRNNGDSRKNRGSMTNMIKDQRNGNSTSNGENRGNGNHKVTGDSGNSGNGSEPSSSLIYNNNGIGALPPSGNMPIPAPRAPRYVIQNPSL